MNGRGQGGLGVNSSGAGWRWVWGGCLLLLVGIGSGRALAVAGDDPVGLQGEVEALVGQSRYTGVRWGVQVVSLDSGLEWVSIRAGERFVPASNTKLYTAALALDRLGPGHRIRTSLFAAHRPDGQGVLTGDLVVFGRGDPSFSARFQEGRIDRALASLVEAVWNAGVRRITGDLVADESYFLSAPLGSGWEWDDGAHAYGAEVSALSVNDNVVRVHVRPGAWVGEAPRVLLEPSAGFMVLENHARTGSPGAGRDLQVQRASFENRVFLTGTLPLDDAGLVRQVAVREPAAWFGELLREALERRGIRIAGRVRREDALSRALAPVDPAAWIEIGRVESPPLAILLGEMLKTSQNLHAQLLLFQVGARSGAGVIEFGSRPGIDAALARRSAAGNDTAESAGIRELNRFLRTAGIPADDVVLEEGSGLSRRHLVTPAATTRLLAFMARHPQAAAFREALPAPGEPGTLRSRLPELANRDRVRAKTGYLRHTHALSGYVTTAAGERLAFSVLVNGAVGADIDRSVRSDLDRLIERVAAVGQEAAAPR